VFRNTIPNSGIFAKGSWTHTFSPTLVNDASYTYVRSTGENPGALSGRELPNVNVTGMTGFSQWGPAGWVHNNFNFHEALSYIRGSHNIRVGVDVDRQQDLDNFTLGLIRPLFGFSNILDFGTDRPFSQGAIALDTKTGQPATNLYQRILMLYTGAYVQDDWKISRKLTLNLGLRYDYFGHLATAANGDVPFSLFTLGQGSSLQEQISSGFMKSRGDGAGYVVNNRVWGFAPRFGFGWDVFGNGSLAVRGGWGLYYNRIGNLAFAAPSRSNAPEYATPTLTIQDTDPARFTYVPGNSDGTGFPAPLGVSFQIDPSGGLVGTRTGVAGLVDQFDPPRTQNWMVSIQKRLANDLLLEADYVGSDSKRLYLQTDVNRIPGDLVRNNGRALRLHQSFSGVVFGLPVGTGNAHLASVMIAKRFSKGYSLRGIYTYGKALDLTSSNDNGVGGARNVFNALDPESQRGRADYDIGKRFTIDSVWEVPFPWSSPVARNIFGGWTLSTIGIFQSGRPFTVFHGAAYPAGDFNADGFNYDTPNTPSFGNYLAVDRSAFIRGLFTATDFPRPAPGTQGDLGRNTFDGPGLANVNLNVAKSFRTPWWSPEGALLQFRGEIFNLLNRVNLTQPDSNLASGLFGRSTDQNLPRAVQFGLRLQF
jgi:hypothetical protein